MERYFNPTLYDTCILCKNKKVKIVKRISVSNLILSWQKIYKVDITLLADKFKYLNLYECNNCGLQYFLPQIVGDYKFYSDMSIYSWYYMDDKWEHEMALKDISITDGVLEIGSGRGSFLELLDKRGVEYIHGIEINKLAVVEAKSRGINISNINVHDLVESDRCKYDVVCHFQVLEHVSDPHKFLSSCIRLLKKKGRLIISTPNIDSFIRNIPGDLLNMPPHHQTRWSIYTYKMLAKLFNLKLEKIIFEPLAKYHSRAVAISWMNRILKEGIDNPTYNISDLPLVKKGLLSIFSRTVGNFLNITNCRRIIKGHTIYGVFVTH